MPQGVKNPLHFGFPGRLARLRLATNATALSLAQAAGVALATWTGIEDRDHVALISTVEKMAAGLGVSPCWLAFGPQGCELFNPRRALDALPPDDPIPRPGAGVFRARHQGIPARLRTRRMELALSLRKLAAAAKVSHTFIVNLEAARSAPGTASVESVARALWVSPCWLAFGPDCDE